MSTLLIVASLILTVGVYRLSRFMFLRYNKHPLLNVLILSSTLIIVLLRVCNFTYTEYNSCKDIINYLIGPATVALAVPIFKNKSVIKKYIVLILAAIMCGSLVSLAVTVLVSKLTGVNGTLAMLITPKSVNVPLEAAKYMSGTPSLILAIVVVTGLVGSIIGPTLLTKLKVTDPVARGIALGSIAHGQGTAIAIQEGEMQGAMAGLAMVVMGVSASLGVTIAMSMFK